jgi:hypothetical protein
LPSPEDLAGRRRGKRGPDEFRGDVLMIPRVSPIANQGSMTGDEFRRGWAGSSPGLIGMRGKGLVAAP